MKALKLFFVAFTLLVFQPYLLNAQRKGCPEKMVKNGNDAPDSQKKTSKHEFKTIVLPLCNHLNLPIEIDREQLIQHYNEMIDEIDRAYHSPETAMQEAKGPPIAVATPDKGKEKE